MLARVLGILAPARAVEPIDDTAEIDSRYRYWRGRILYTSLVGYALFYLVRTNLPVALPAMIKDLHITKEQAGAIITVHGVCYGLSKFANGFLGDRTNPRIFMGLGLLLCAVMNVGFGLSSVLTLLGGFWLLNGWFQGMGFPPCAKSLTHWFGARERGTTFAIWNTSHSIGAASALILCSVLVAYGWRYCLLIPAAIAAVGAVLLIVLLRDTPRSLGLPAIEEYKGEVDEQAGPKEDLDGESFRRFVIRHVFFNPTVWTVSLANFFVYTVRYAVVSWGPTFLTETKGIHLQYAGWTVAAYEIMGIFGMLSTGWMTDRIFKGRAGRACFFSMFMCGLCLYLFWRYPLNLAFSTVLLCGVGFFIYGPQCLVGVIAVNAASRRAAATAIGVTGLFGYLSTVLSGWGIGRLAERGGWDPVFLTLVASAGIATLLFALCWNAGQRLEQTRD